MTHPVVIAGAGPVGLMLACDLAAAGVDTVLAERLAAPDGRSPGMAINATVVELLAQRGLMDRLQEDGLSWPSAHFAQLWLDPAKLTEPHETTFLIHQGKLEQRLEERARELGVDIRRGRTLTALEQDEEGVTVTFTPDAASGAAESLRASYVVGCDGQNSTVRTIAGIDFPGTADPFHGIVADVAVEPDDILLQRFGVHQAAGGLFTVAPAGPGVLRVTTGEFGRDPDDAAKDPTWDEMRESVKRLVDLDLTTGTPLWLDRWDNQSRIVDDYRKQRVFLAGEAAHVHFPLGGQSLSSCIEDAVNLAWKLAADLTGWAPEGLLDTYNAERRPIGERACLTTKAQVALMHPMDRIAPLRQFINELIQLPQANDYLVKVAGGLEGRYPTTGPDDHPLTGRRLGKHVLRAKTDDGTQPRDGRLADVLTVDRGLLLDLTDDSAFAEHAKPWSDRVDHVAAELDPKPKAAAALLRPDGRIVWAADAASETDVAALKAALTKWFTREA
jgi:2-polyprenyl-6-methoxyphenol hydroxylase-like FAD-dependent oxidoreductase